MHFAAEIGIARQVLQGADRHHGGGRIDRHAAAIGMGQRHHVIDVGIFRQQLALMRLTANSIVPATHCTLVVIARIFLVPTEPSALR